MAFAESLVRGMVQRLNKTALLVFSLMSCVLVALLLGHVAMAKSGESTKKEMYYGPVPPPELGGYEVSSSCSSCHEKIYKQFSESMHAKSFSNPAFQAEFFRKLLPLTQKDTSLSGEAAGCIACHSPVTFARTNGIVLSPKDVNPEISGVECDFCHTVSGYKEPGPGGGNYITRPGKIKLGPFKTESDFHKMYSELQTKSEVCAICHNRENRYGLEIISTFTEWKRSRYAQKGIQCQDCHMNLQGFLTGGQPVFDSGRASQNNLAMSPVRSKLYTHQFPGAHSKTQVKGAVELDIKVEKALLQKGREVEVLVLVDNSKSGHKMPTGSAELRMLYLDLTAKAGDNLIPIQANSLYEGMHDVSGMGSFDREILGSEFPRGRRLYRAICIDEEGYQTLYSYDASEIIFDNRLNADEIRKEIFHFKIPEDIGNELTFIAKLYYVRYPVNFAESLNLPIVEPVELASAQKILDL